MRWVHLRISTSVRVLGRLGGTGAFTRRTEQHARGPVKKHRPLFTGKNCAADLKTTTFKPVMSAGCTTCNIYNRNTQYLQLKTSKTHMVV